jgi:hypothetical protein
MKTPLRVRLPVDLPEFNMYRGEEYDVASVSHAHGEMIVDLEFDEFGNLVDLNEDEYEAVLWTEEEW